MSKLLNEKIPAEKTPNENVRLQSLRDFTVQIRHSKTDAIVGTGIAFSQDGRIITCAHVVEAAGVEYRSLKAKDLGVYFPQVRGGEEKKRRAIVEKFFSNKDDDIVLLKLTDGPSPLAPEQIAVLGYSDYSEGHPFLSYGYSAIEPYQSIRAGGIVLGSVEPPDNVDLYVDPMQLQSRQIDVGMSGAGVLDVERNLVVGLVAERYFPKYKGPIKDDVSWAVDSKILTFDPFNFSLRVDPLPLRPAASPKTDEQTQKDVVAVARTTFEERIISDKYSWNSAPSVLTEWTGRDHLLAQINEDWKDPKKHVTGLIGFGGEGKSSLVRKWVDELLNNSSQPQPDGIFWWGFYENRSIDEFLEAALKYLSGGRIDPRQVPSSSLRAQIIGAMLGAGRYLFVLDGLEVMQHQEGDQYGLLTSNDLRDLLTFFARPDNQSFCLITSRAPLLDLMEYTTYTHRDVDHLSNNDGCALLEKLGVKGTKAQMSKIVTDWNGHALTLSLVGSYLVKRYQGDAKHADEIKFDKDEFETTAPEQYKHVSRILRRYDEHLSESERAFMLLFSAFRTPVRMTAFDKVFRSKTDASAINMPLTKLSDADFKELLKRLETYRMLRRDPVDKSYTTHPLIRNHYLALLTRDNVQREDVQRAHATIKDYYLSIAGDTPQYPTLNDLKSLIEVVHHACQAGAYDEALNIYKLRIQRIPETILVYQLGAFDTDLNLLLEFIYDKDIERMPQVSDLQNQRFILSEIGLCYSNLGLLRQAASAYERKNRDYEKTSTGYRNLAQIYWNLGNLEASKNTIQEGLKLSLISGDKNEILRAYAYQAFLYYLKGDLSLSMASFEKAMETQKEANPGYKYLILKGGNWFANILRRTKDLAGSRRVVEANLNLSNNMHQIFLISECNYILGDLDFDLGNHESARVHYESALKIARSISDHPALIEALLARGKFYAKAILAKVPSLRKDELQQAFTDLNEALNYAVEGGYRIYEADIRVALGWAYLANGEKQRAKESAERALQMSQDMGYHWGKVDAQEVLERIESSE